MGESTTPGRVNIDTIVITLVRSVLTVTDGARVYSVSFNMTIDDEELIMADPTMRQQKQWPCVV